MVSDRAVEAARSAGLPLRSMDPDLVGRNVGEAAKHATR